MLRKSLLVLCFLCSFCAFSQKSTIDSLKAVLKVNKHEDSLQISRLLDLSYMYRTSDLDSAHFYIKKALKVSKAINHKEQEGMSRMYLAQNFKRKGKYAEGLEQILLAKHLLDSTEALREQRLIANSELSTFYEAIKNHEGALSIALETLEIVKNDPFSPAKGRFYYDVGNRYMTLNDFEKAVDYYLEAVDICDKTNFLPGKMIMMGSLAAAYKNLYRYSEATTMLEEALPYFEKTGQKTNVAATYQQLGQIASAQGFHEVSIPHYEKARQIFDEVGNLEYSKNTNQALFVAYSIMQDQEKATTANASYLRLKDSIESIERKEMVAEMQTKYETEKMGLEKEAAEAASIRNKNYLIGSLVIASLILLSSLFFFGRIRARKKADLITLELRETQKRLALEKQYRDSELKALKSQMNPHFIFNALNSIQEYIVMNKKNEASDYLGKFADLIRTYLGHSDTGVISLQEEIDSLRMYLDLESLRFEDKLVYELKVTGHLNKEMIYIPTMLIQPYIENALKHGLLHKKDNRHLQVTFSPSEDNTIECIVEDNGVGRAKAKEFQANRNSLHKSFAAKATEERLELLNYGKDKKIGVTIEDLYDDTTKVSGTRVILNIPIQKG